MANLQSHVSRLLSAGRVSPATYRLLTGLALLVVGVLLWGARSDDRAAGPVAVVLLVAAIASIATAARELRSHPAS